MFSRFGVTFQKGDVIFCEYEPGDNFYLIQSGRVQLVKIMGDIEKIIDILEPGEIFGEMSILEEAPRSATAIAYTAVKAMEFNRENFEILMQGNPQIAMKLLKTFTRRIYDQKRRFMILTLTDIEAKVADVFLMLAERLPKDEAAGELKRVEFSTAVDDIAHWGGISPEKCKSVLSRFVSQARIEIYPDRIVVKNINDFARFVATQRRQKDGV
jgi:CRP/FNR family transcriptional regulator, cyclic AMP receptor protein